MAEKEQNRQKNTRQAKRPASEETNFGKLQPQSLDFEKAVLGAMMIEREAYSLVCEILKPESFYDHRHELIYTAIQNLSQADRPIDILTITEQLKRNGTLEEAGGPLYISELSMIVGNSAHVEFHARVIAQKHLARELISYTSKVQTRAFDETVDIDQLMQEAEGELFEISRTNIKKDYTQIDPVLKEAYKALQIAASNKSGISGIPSGFEALDKITNGWQNSDLIIIAARPAMGKTAFTLSMAKNIAVDMQIPVAFFSLEMSNIQLVNRLIVNVCEIKGEKIRSGQLEQYEWGQLDIRINSLYGAKLYVDDTPSLSVFELRTKARRLVREHGVRLIMIDYLQLMNASGMKHGNRQEEVSTISRSLKSLAKELNIPIIALSQLNRSVESRENKEGTQGKRPQLSDLRESGAIEQDADLVAFIHRPEYYGIKADENNVPTHGKAQIIIAKHRNGQVGDVTLRFKAEFARFENDNESQIPFPGEEGNNITGSKINNYEDTPPPPDESFPLPTDDSFMPSGQTDEPPF